MSMLPPDILAQQQDLTRQQRMAELLMGQGMQQPQGQMVSGQYVAPSFFQNLTPLVSMLASKNIGEKADKKSVDLAKALRGKYADELSQYQQMMNPAPTLAPEQAGPALNAQGQSVPIARDMIETKPDRLAANLFAANAYNPALQSVGIKKLTEGPKWEKAEFVDEKSGRTRQGVIDMNASDPTSTFREGGVKPALTEKEKQSLQIDRERLNLSRAAENRAAQQFSFETGMPAAGGGGGGGGVPMQQGGAPMQNAAPAQYQTVGQGSPILARGQQQPAMQQPAMQPQANPNAPPVFRTKAEQDVWIASQKEKNTAQNKAIDALPNALTTVESGLSAINGLIGDTKVDAKGNLVYGQVPPHAGFKTAVGVSGLTGGFGAAGFLPATDTTDFKQRFKQIEGKSFLAAIDSLRGTGQITEVEGAKATAAINRMSLAQSEKEFVTAANELRDVMNIGYQNAQKRAGVKPMNPNAQPTGQLKPDVVPKMRFDLNTGEWVR